MTATKPARKAKPASKKKGRDATPAEPYGELCGLLHEAATLGSVLGLLSWDQETYMPPVAGSARGEQKGALARLCHERSTSPRIGALLKACTKSRTLNKAGLASAANLREIRRDYDHATKLPGSLVAEMARVGTQAQQAWKEAREKSDFAAFAPWLEKVLVLAKRKAELLGLPNPGRGELYDAALDQHEPGLTTQEIESIFTPLRPRLAALIARVVKSKVCVDTRCLQIKVDPAAQHAFGQVVLDRMGFDLKAGRLDVTTHPFCSGFAPGDTRLTTRYRDEKFTDALYGTMHEAGHGLYEQGLPKLDSRGGHGLFGQPLADAASLGIHESQSRLWENWVGRSEAFWRWALPQITKRFGREFARLKPAQLFAATNTVAPSLIRVEADEATYNLHIIIRFEIERALFRDEIRVRDIPSEWNRRYKEYLGVDVPDDRRGCLQDVHWSLGAFGYFPTYTLGNLYAAQLWEAIQSEIPGLERKIARAELLDLKAWLNAKIHRHGRRYRAAELCRRVTGKPLSADPLLRHLERKAKAVYGV